MKATYLWLNHFNCLIDDSDQDLASISKWKEFYEKSDDLRLKQNSLFIETLKSIKNEHSEYVSLARIDGALGSLFLGRWPLDARPNKKLRATGCIPQLFKEGLNPDHVASDKRLMEWTQKDHTKDGKGLGIIGSFGSEAEVNAVWAVIQMFRNYPFRDPIEEDSFTDAKLRTCGFYSASEISKAIEVIGSPKESNEEDFLEDCRTHEVVIIASLGDIPMGVSTSYEFYNLLEFRRLHFLPTVWTSQFSAEELMKRFSPKVSGLILQNLRHAGRIIKLSQTSPMRAALAMAE